jgi:hypothetical protein
MHILHYYYYYYFGNFITLLLLLEIEQFFTKRKRVNKLIFLLRDGFLTHQIKEHEIKLFAL